ncbi:hypothetical protein [Novosphingobium sp. Gsoil 351]|uniref:hypothetical protein n=1 Tax=Novosphingobium sp. Gsoil 351 TaxID=2675225 RepID=UPI0018A7F4D0|nr:hypothetical protein [Novosphingobium sp. Gsoil 351]
MTVSYRIEWMKVERTLSTMEIFDLGAALETISRDLPGYSRRSGVTHAIVRDDCDAAVFDSRSTQ